MALEAQRAPLLRASVTAALCAGAGALALLKQPSNSAPPAWTFAAATSGQPQPLSATSQALRGAASEGLNAATAGAGGDSSATAYLALCTGAVALAAAVGRSSAPSARHRRSVPRTVARAFEEELGVQAPLGYWDPLGFSKDGDYEEFYRRRSAELKNGRVAMYATIGYIVPEYWRLPGYLSPSGDLTFDQVPNGIQALGKVPVEGWLQILAYCGWLEVVVNQPQNPEEPGNYYKGRLGVIPLTKINDEDMRKRSLNAELANGRLAMMAILGMFFQDGLTGSAWGDWSLYTASPLR